MRGANQLAVPADSLQEPRRSPADWRCGACWQGNKLIDRRQVLTKDVAIQLAIPFQALQVPALTSISGSWNGR